MRNDKEDTILRSDAIEAVYRAYRRPSDDEVFIRMREELERVPETSVATIQANVKVDMDELVKRVTEEIRNSFILDPVKRGRWELISRTEHIDRSFSYWLKCSVCGGKRRIKEREGIPRWCEHCGSIMEGVDDGK